MTREELVALREKILLGDPHYTTNSMGDKLRTRGVPGLDERKRMSDYDASASGARFALEICLQLTTHLLERMRKQ